MKEVIKNVIYGIFLGFLLWGYVILMFGAFIAFGGE